MVSRLLRCSRPATGARFDGSLRIPLESPGRILTGGTTTALRQTRTERHAFAVREQKTTKSCNRTPVRSLGQQDSAIVPPALLAEGVLCGKCLVHPPKIPEERNDGKLSRSVLEPSRGCRPPA